MMTVFQIIVLASLAAQGFALIGKCDFTQDCDYDEDCESGLICADKHKDALKAFGYDGRLANCGDIGVTQRYWEVCFDASILPTTPSSSSFGDPHFMTYDGTQYSYHGQCDLVLARSPEFGSGLGLDIHARTEIVNNWSLISNAAVRIGDDILELRNDNTHYFNGVEGVELPVTMSGRYIISRGEITINHESEENGDARTDRIVEYTIDLENGESIKISNYRSMIAVNVNAFLSGTEGMLGKLQKDGMIGRDGETALEDPNQMGAQWQVRDTEPMLFHEVRAPQYPETCTLPSNVGRSLRQSIKDLNVAEEACRNVGADMMKFCIDDVVMTGDVNIAAGYSHFKFGSAF